MFISKRERPPDKSIANKFSATAYQRTSIPPISVVPLGLNSTSAQRRAPLAPLDPQLASQSALDDQMPSSTTSPASHVDQSQLLDSSRDGDAARAAIGRQIVARPHEEDADSSSQTARRRSLSGHTSSVRSLPYPPPRTAQRRPSNTPSNSSSSSRRPSIPGHQHSSQNVPPTVPSPPLQAATSIVDSFYAHDDLYSGLSTFTFGAVRTSPSQAMDTSDMISPLSRVSGSGSADRTPRPSISAASGGRRKSHSNKVSDPAEGDDEYEDEDDDVRGKSRSKMRAIDDGTRRPSLPTNSLVPAPSTVLTTASASPISSNTESGESPIDLSGQSQESELESSEPEGEETEAAEFDTDVELDLPHGNHGRSMDPPVSDAASQRTFGAGSFDHYGYWQPTNDDDELAAREEDYEDEEEEVGSISPVTFRHEDEEGYDDGDRPLPSLAANSSRRGSVPWETLTPRITPTGREREDSVATIGPRGSKSVDDLAAASVETVQPQARRDSRNVELQPSSPLPGSGPADTEFQYGPYDLNYILSGVESRKSWSSGASSYVQPTARRGEGDLNSAIAPWDTELFRSGRRPSTVTVGSSEDAFTRHIRALDPDYNEREGRWSFKKESTDGRGPHRMQLAASSTNQAPAGPSSHTMMPQTQEMWRQEFVGRYKVDRLRLPTDARAQDKGPQQRLHVRHIPDPYLRSGVRGGPHAVIHKHSKVVAFSIFRHNNVLPPHARKDARTPFDRSGGILLANKRVQEAYTSTHTTSRLNSHGLLADSDARGLDGTTIVGSTVTTSHHSRPSTPGSSDTNALPFASGALRASASPPPPKESLDGTVVSTSFTAISLESAGSSSDHSVASVPVSSLKTRSSTLFSQPGRSSSSSRRNSIDTDDSDSPPRTSHAEAFATVDSSYFELMRARTTPRHTEESQSSSRLSAFRKFFGPQRGHSSHGTSSPSAPREGNYNPPWVVLAPRSKQEESQRVIQNLNESFQDVGLLPANSRSGGRNKSHKGKARSDQRDRQTGSILEKVPKDSLYMLLPLWPGETDPATSKVQVDPSLYQLRVEDRQYLLVYYVPFEEKDKDKADRNKKRSRGTKIPGSNPSGSIVDVPLFLLRSFRVNARLVSYDDLRGTGVRVPSYGLTITGSMADGMRYLPSPSIREQRLDEVVICHCTSRNSGMKFDPDGLSKLGLCMPTDTPSAMQIPDSVIPEPEEAVLTPIGRAAVEMAWLGCMAVTSFGTV
ncbi:hypothetical protein BDW22DRAFT_1376566 [Trametopsis cervina]|nr:hypothetical protein BDW22DRAFT_1376566 [Trametopsis cervina]